MLISPKFSLYFSVKFMTTLFVIHNGLTLSLLQKEGISDATPDLNALTFSSPVIGFCDIGITAYGFPSLSDKYSAGNVSLAVFCFILYVNDIFVTFPSCVLYIFLSGIITRYAP